MVIWKRIDWVGESSASTVPGWPDSLADMGLGVVCGVAGEMDTSEWNIPKIRKRRLYVGFEYYSGIIDYYADGGCGKTLEVMCQRFCHWREYSLA